MEVPTEKSAESNPVDDIMHQQKVLEEKLDVLSTERTKAQDSIKILAQNIVDLEERWEEIRWEIEDVERLWAQEYATRRKQMESILDDKSFPWKREESDQNSGDILLYWNSYNIFSLQDESGAYESRMSFADILSYHTIDDFYISPSVSGNYYPTSIISYFNTDIGTGISGVKYEKKRYVDKNCFCRE